MPGTTLLLDLAFPAFPDNFGHWAEAIVPIYNVLSARAWKSSIPSGSSTHIDTLIFVNLRREQLAVCSMRLLMMTLTLLMHAAFMIPVLDTCMIGERQSSLNTAWEAS